MKVVNVWHFPVFKPLLRQALRTSDFRSSVDSALLRPITDSQLRLNHYQLLYVGTVWSRSTRTCPRKQTAAIFAVFDIGLHSVHLTSLVHFQNSLCWLQLGR